jgi:hypothetical protein
VIKVPSGSVLWFTDDDSQMGNILLLDSPVGSGFSYARDPKGYHVGDYSSSLHVQRFLNKVTRSQGSIVHVVPFDFWLMCGWLCSGSRIIRSTFRIISTLLEIHMLER